jgi:hypothetical protein
MSHRSRSHNVTRVASLYKRPLPTRIQPESDAPTKVAETIWILKFIVHGAVLAHKMLH